MPVAGIMPAALVAIPLVSLPTPLPFGIQVSAPIFGLVAALAVFAPGNGRFLCGRGRLVA